MRDAAIDPLRQPGRGAARPRNSGAPPLDGMLGEERAPRDQRPASRQGGITSAAIAAQRLGGGRALGAARRGAQPGVLTRLRARLPRVRPFKALTIATFSVALVGIVANAMVFQRGRHPAPLFGLGLSVDGQPDAPQRTAAALAAAAPAPVERTGTIAPAPAAEPAVPVPAAPPKPAPVHHAAKPHPADGIGGLLAAKGPGAAAPASSAHLRPGHTGTTPAKGADAGATASHPKGAAKPAAKVDAAPRPVQKATAPADRDGAADAAAILARPDHARQPKVTAQPRPHAAKPAAQADAAE